MEAISGPVTAPMAFDRLSKYIRSFHSNVVSEFRNFDKDSSGALSVIELRRAFTKLGVMMPMATWEAVVGIIDDNDTGEVEYAEFLSAMDRYRKGGWDAVERKYVNKLSPGEEERARRLFYEAMDKIRKAAYSMQKSGVRRDMDLDLREVFNAMDKDGDKMITKEELAGYVGLEEESEQEERCRRQAEKKKHRKAKIVNGVIKDEEEDDLEDEEGNRRGINANLTKHEMDALFSFFDRDGGGADFGEFAYAFFNRRQLQKRVERSNQTVQENMMEEALNR